MYIVNLSNVHYITENICKNILKMMYLDLFAVKHISILCLTDSNAQSNSSKQSNIKLKLTIMVIIFN